MSGFNNIPTLLTFFLKKPLAFSISLLALNMWVLSRAFVVLCEVVLLCTIVKEVLPKNTKKSVDDREGGNSNANPNEMKVHT